VRHGAGAGARARVRPLLCNYRAAAVGGALGGGVQRGRGAVST
jgi:hypothetical protein